MVTNVYIERIKAKIVIRNTNNGDMLAPNVVYKAGNLFLKRLKSCIRLTLTVPLDNKFQVYILVECSHGNT